jgi:hypothetical protein
MLGALRRGVGEMSLDVFGNSLDVGLVLRSGIVAAAPVTRVFGPFISRFGSELSRVSVLSNS